MITQTELRAKIDEFTELKAQLIKKRELIDPNTTRVFFTKEDIKTQKDTAGVTITSLETMMETILKEINAYVEEMRSTPFIESSPIQTSSAGSIEIWEVGVPNNLLESNKIGSNLTIEDVGVIGGEVSVSTSMTKLVFTSDTKIKTENMEVNIPHEVVILKVNPRRQVLETYRSGNGPMHLTIPGSDIQFDDIYFVGLSLPAPLEDMAPYYFDLSFSIRKELANGTVEIINRTIGDKSIGIHDAYFDPSVSNHIVAHSIVASEGIVVKITDSNVVTNVRIGDAVYGTGTSSPGNKIIKVGVNGTSVNTGLKNLSQWKDTSAEAVLHRARYDVYNMEDPQETTVIFSNLRPISDLIQESIDAL